MAVYYATMHLNSIMRSFAVLSWITLRMGVLTYNGLPAESLDTSACVVLVTLILQLN